MSGLRSQSKMKGISNALVALGVVLALFITYSGLIRDAMENRD